MKVFSLISSIVVIATSVAGYNLPYFQCGGKYWKGSSDCPLGYSCTEVNTYISQCKPLSSPKLIAKLEGFAEGTTGGHGGEVITVDNQTDLENAVLGNDPKIVRINGIIELNKDITLHSNTTLIGANDNSGLTGAGIYFKSVSNIIIQNLKFSYCLGSSRDCIGGRRSSNIWIDHCEFYSDLDHDKDYYDGLIDFSYACENITISWNYIHDHSKVSLIGHSDSYGSTDSGKFHITYHHNYFRNCISRLPSLRFATAHIYNNVYEDIDYIAINSRMGTQALVEYNIFRNVTMPIATDRESIEEGFVNERHNNFGSKEDINSITQIGNFTTAPYKYHRDGLLTLYYLVTKNAGPQ